MQDDISLEVGKLLSKAYASCEQFSSLSAICTLDKAEQKCLDMVVDVGHKLEVKRRVAELKLQILCDHKAQFSLVKDVRENLIGLGFTNLEREIANEVYFVSYCEKIGEIKAPRDVLEKLKTKIKFKLETIENNSPEYSFYSYNLNDLDGRLKKY